jgi:hypothetical protein
MVSVGKGRSAPSSPALRPGTEPERCLRTGGNLGEQVHYPFGSSATPRARKLQLSPATLRRRIAKSPFVRAWKIVGAQIVTVGEDTSVIGGKKLCILRIGVAPPKDVECPGGGEGLLFPSGLRAADLQRRHRLQLRARSLPAPPSPTPRPRRSAISRPRPTFP